ncbi:MAG: ECF transporter S component [Actinobacteria bacterium]|nr:ECF transporter S component [Actinomycetota bacterium]
MEKKRRKYYFSTFHLILMAIIAGIGGVINGAFMYTFIQPFKPLFTFLGPISWVPLSGLYVVWPIIARLLIRKRGASTLYGLIQGFVEMLAGNRLGPWAILFAGMEGLLVDIGFELFKDKAKLFGSLLGAALANLVAVEIYFFLFKMTSPYELLVGGIVAIISGIILAGLLGWIIVRALYNTGIIKERNP